MTYGSWQLRWSCKTKELCDGGSSHSYYNYLEDLSSRLYSTPLTTLYPDSSARGFLVPSTESDGYGQYKSMMNLWPSIVEEFTKRELSMVDDRPLAISGLAKEYGRLIGDEYLAGLWAGNLVNGLLWRRKAAFRGPRQRSPSWSWTSIDGWVQWMPFIDTSGAKLVLLDCKIRLVSPLAPFGAVESACITIQGRLRKAWFDAKQREQIRFHPWSTDTWRPSTLTAALATWDYLDGDADSQASCSAALWCLEVFRFLPAQDGVRGTDYILRPNGILLTQEFGTGNFRRRGYFDFRWESKIYSEHYDAGIEGFQNQRDNFRKEVFEGCPLSIITIM